MAFPSGTMPSRVQTETIIETGTYSYECWLTEDFITGCRLCAIFSICFFFVRAAQRPFADRSASVCQL